MTPALGSARLRLLPHQPALVTEEQVAWLNDPVVVRYSEQRHKTHTLESQRAYVQSFADSPNHIWLIRLHNGMDVGTITAHIDEINKIADLGILLNRNATGLGIGTEAWGTVIDYLFKVQGIRKVTCGMMRSNLPMFKVASKNGMRIEGERYDHFILDGEPVGLLMMAKFNESRLAVALSRAAGENL